MINNSTCYALSLLRGPMHVEKGSRNGAAIHVKGTPTVQRTPLRMNNRPSERRLGLGQVRSGVTAAARDVSGRLARSRPALGR